MSGDEHSDRNTAKVETDRVHGDGHHARFPHLVAEAGSIVLHVSSSMKTVKKKAGQQQQERLNEISRKDAEIRRLIELRISTPKEEKQRMKELSKSIKKCIRDKKTVKRQQVIQKILEDFKGVSIPGIKSAKKKVFITKEKSLHHVLGSPKSLVNSTKNFTTTMSKTNMEMKATLTCTSATLKK